MLILEATMKKISLLLLIVSLTACGSPTDNNGAEPEEATQEPPAVTDVTATVNIIKTRCGTCHSANPTDDMFKVAPGNVMFDSVEEIQKSAARIRARAVDTQTMPFMNKTNMTDQERSIVGQWIKAGAPDK